MEEHLDFIMIVCHWILLCNVVSTHQINKIELAVLWNGAGKYIHTNLFFALESIFHTSILIIIVVQNMMLLDQWTSCLKHSHTNLQSYMGNGISYFGASSILYAKTSPGNIKSICLKDSHTNDSNNVGIHFWYFGISFKMMLLALWTNCLKDIHTNFQKYIGMVTKNFEDFTRLYAKNDAASSMN